MSKYQTILAVCETHSISKAASKLNYTQSAVSQTIKNFEKELGVPLFKRSKQGMELLPGTEEIMDSLRIICQEENKISQIAAGLTSLEKGHIRIGTIQSISYHWLPDILRDFSKSYPNIRFELTVDGFSALKEKIQSDQLDCIFVSRYSVPDLPFIPLGSDELMLVTPLDHPLAEQLTVSLTDISGENFVLSSDGLDYETGKIFETNHITPKIQYQLNEDFATLKTNTCPQFFCSGGDSALLSSLGKENQRYLKRKPFRCGIHAAMGQEDIRNGQNGHLVYGAVDLDVFRQMFKLLRIRAHGQDYLITCVLQRIYAVAVKLLVLVDSAHRSVHRLFSGFLHRRLDWP